MKSAMTEWRCLYRAAGENVNIVDWMSWKEAVN